MAKSPSEKGMSRQALKELVGGHAKVGRKSTEPADTGKLRTTTAKASGTPGDDSSSPKNTARPRRKSRRLKNEMPWERHDPDAPPDKAMNFRTNAYDRALLKYMAGLRGISAQAVLQDLMRTAAFAELE